MVTKQNTTSKFERTLTLLHDPQASFAAEAIYSLSDLAGAEWDAFRATWPDLPVERRRDLVLRLVETAETNFELDFSAVIHLALEDPDPEVRRNAVEGVLEDAAMNTIERVMRMALHDPFSDVRAAAVRTLGLFVLQGELGKLPDYFNTRLQDTVLALYNDLDEDFDVRRRALEAISNCGLEGVQDMIYEAYQSDELPMRVSAIYAMGRSCDDMWSAQILDELSSDEPELRYEAARAAGELELQKALPRLVELAYEDDREIQEAAIWSLGEIGGSTARKVLTELAALADDVGDEELADAIAESLSMASLAGQEMLPLFDFGDYDDEDDEDDDDLDLLRGDDYDEDDEDDEEEDADAWSSFEEDLRF
ncbi:MAG TPA: HEAT repeat domain-containing protein [Aggregatilinea sp.]|jgi:HEAT repeat protein|uniref:HEAT repeat domain-containing protein n=1 Tax=Aggregatilinea sp. TaxID=2806333 RepID=UPI002C6D792D|nr:HEAT repeat domain-containing protein [Aggregatilinea sp.]HML22532.1 HEAT repeat domain-containing protein [Aggregatilinea sp.]